MPAAAAAEYRLSVGEVMPVAGTAAFASYLAEPVNLRLSWEYRVEIGRAHV